MGLTARFWNRRYETTPSWELGTADPVLVRTLDDRGVVGPGRALDVGCGTGDNAIEFRLADVTRFHEEAPFELIVDRGLLMSLFGERARRSYAWALIRLTTGGSCVYQDQWELPQAPRALSPGWVATAVKGVVVAPGEVERRLGDAFLVETLRRSVEPTDDPGMRRTGIRCVAKMSYWLQRKPGSATG